MSNFDPSDMLLFAKVVELHSLSAASRLTSRPKATISRAITRLEAALDARLLERSARKTTVTEAGRVFYEYCQRVGLAIEEAEGAVGELQGKVQGTLKVGSSVTIGQTLLAVLIPDFVAAYPGLVIKLELTNRNIDLVEEGFDVVLKAGPLADSSMIAKDLGVLSYGIFASPDHLAEAATIERPADLARAPVVDNFEGKETVAWELRRGEEMASVLVRPRLDFNDAFMRREAVLKGAGIGLIPNWICREALAAGHLVRVLPDWTSARFVRVHAIWPSRLHPTPRLRAFLDYLAENMPKLLSD
jgi:LysR family transcriptional regulator for bpeEF and oprC